MAILRAFYLEGLRSILVRAYQAEGWAIIAPLLPYAVEWVKAGSTAQIKADRRETVRALLTALWATNHARHDAHTLRHVMVDAGVLDMDAEDVPETVEPML